MRIVIAVALLLILAGGATVAYQSALEEGGEQTALDNESWSPDAGNVTTLSDSGLDVFYDETVDVRDSNGNTMEAGVDYEWFATNGTVKALSGGDLDGESTAYIDYGYSNPTEQQRERAALLSNLPTVIGIAIPGVAALILFGRFVG
jgi:hypothetical protein